MIKCELAFPSTIYVCDLNDRDYRQNLIDYTRYRQASDPVGVDKTNMGGGWQSQDNFLDNRVCSELKRDLSGFVENIRESLTIVEEIKIYNSWVNVNPTGAYNASHTHPRNIFSGCYYLQAPENSGNIIFHSPLIAKGMLDATYKDFSIVTANNLIYPAIAGRCYIFPSWLMHSVQMNRSSEDRISMSFNIFFDKF